MVCLQQKILLYDLTSLTVHLWTVCFNFCDECRVCSPLYHLYFTTSVVGEVKKIAVLTNILNVDDRGNVVMKSV